MIWGKIATIEYHKSTDFKTNKQNQKKQKNILEIFIKEETEI